MTEKKYIDLRSYASYLNIEAGDVVFISSDTKTMLWDAIKNKANCDLNLFIDGLKDAVGSDGTVIFPTYNWSFCRGEPFDYKNTPCETGVLGSIALKREDFRRTRHPLYSFAVSGKYQKLLCEMTNTDSFGMDSPFAFFKTKNVKNYIIDVSLEHCFTYVHFVEQQSGFVHHRYIKDFTSKYIDENGNEDKRTCSMFVRDLDMDVRTTIDPIQEDFIREGVERKLQINHSNIKCIKMGDAYDIILNDIKNNRSRKLCTYKGQ